MHPGKQSRRAKLPLAAVAAALALAAFSGCDLQEEADAERGEQLFVARCGSCHALTAAGTNSNVGPDLDLAFRQARLNGMDQDTIEGVVESQIDNPRPASPEDTQVYMPADLVEGEDLRDVAAYVAGVAGVPGIQPPQFVAQDFFATNCGSCHTLKAAGTTATVGPDLDQVLRGQSPQQVSEQIINPDSQITPGYQPNVMPSNFGDTLSPKELNQLVGYLLQSVGGGAAAGGGGAGAGGAGGGGAGGQ
jgi:mono/diheme cytochrome c family protein